MSQIFGEITRIIKKYDGFIERFIGDAVMAVFGIPKAHEDDPIRSIRAAMEIHAAVERLSPKFEKKIGRLLTMHTVSIAVWLLPERLILEKEHTV